MPRTITALLAMATLSAAAPLFAQSAGSAGPSATDPNSDTTFTESYTQPAAPIEHAYADNGQQHAPPPDQYRPPQLPQNKTSQPAPGIWIVSAPDTSVETVSAAADHTELKLEHGRANINVHHPSENSEIVVDLPGGQVSLVKDGLYTFNAEAGTVRVLRGEAVVASEKDREIKVKEDHQFTFGAKARAEEASPEQLRADLLQANYGGLNGPGGYRHGDGYGPGYGYGFYGYPYAYGYPYYGWGPGWGYPYYAYGPWGYPGFGLGLGFGYYGGFRGGYGFGGGFRGGFRR